MLENLARLRGVAVAIAMLGVSLPAKAGTVVGGSDLLTGGTLAQIESWLINDPQLGYNGSLIFTNIFDKQPGLMSTDFHFAADLKGPTIVVMQAALLNGGPTQIIGGFNPLSWNSSQKYNETPNNADRTAFIFNATTADRRHQNTFPSGLYQTYNSAFYGPTFGGGTTFTSVN